LFAYSFSLCLFAIIDARQLLLLLKPHPVKLQPRKQLLRKLLPLPSKLSSIVSATPLQLKVQAQEEEPRKEEEEE